MATKNQLISSQAPDVPGRIDRVVRLPEVLLRVGVSRTTLYTMVRDGRFPAPLHLSTRIRGWRLSSVEAFLSSTEAE